MSDFIDTIRAIQESSEDVEIKMQKLIDLGIPASEVRNMLAQEIVKKKKIQKSQKIKKFESRHTNPNIGKLYCLAIRQPWAMLVACGIKDVELRNEMIPPSRKFFIAASVTKEPGKLQDLLNEEQYTVVEKYLENGSLPPYKEWATGAIIGYVELEKVTYDEVDSIWALGHDGIKYVIKNAYLLDEPIRGKNKATPLFYTVDGYDENNLPPMHKFSF